ncbi:MAG: hypothetical protein JNL69_07995 [Bacteroidia bacterium]|nr:hypothetical protein [Bacteroidia bacterium]
MLLKDRYKGLYRRVGFLSLLCIVLSGCEINKLKIIVPDGFTGEVCLIKSNVLSNELVLDSNGIGYITESTFDGIKFEPIVLSASGKNLSANCVGFSPSVFWARGEFESLEPKVKIKYMSFEIVPDSLIGKKQYYDTDLLKFVDTLKLK